MRGRAVTDEDGMSLQGKVVIVTPYGADPACPALPRYQPSMRMSVIVTLLSVVRRPTTPATGPGGVAITLTTMAIGVEWW